MDNVQHDIGKTLMSCCGATSEEFLLMCISTVSLLVWCLREGYCLSASALRNQVTVMKMIKVQLSPGLIKHHVVMGYCRLHVT
jgi:hypothetical protein